MVFQATTGILKYLREKVYKVYGSSFKKYSPETIRILLQLLSLSSILRPYPLARCSLGSLGFPTVILITSSKVAPGFKSEGRQHTPKIACA